MLEGQRLLGEWKEVVMREYPSSLASSANPRQKLLSLLKWFVTLRGILGEGGVSQ